MIEIGKWNDLIVVKKVNFGVYLGENADVSEKDRILLPEKQVPENIKEGDPLTVFVYRDSEDRMIATVHEPLLTLGQIGRLTVREVTRIGAFLDWGLEKDLFLPFKEQTRKVKEGEVVLAALYKDKSGRLCATMNVYPYLSTRCPYHAGAQVEGTVYETSDNFGVFVAVADAYSGLIPKREAEDADLTIGQKVEVRISRVRKDGKLELSLKDKAYKQMDADAEKIAKAIKEQYGGVLPFDDKADPEQIHSAFGMSKAAFKRAVGALYKERRVVLGDGTIRLAETKH
ncbi:MAG: S1 RNA-binding domain-containing protein [Lachnospiraceae bacterium]|nr:S1 RNA-binding domain-containing protein [Lachnospiraceae bacterium]